MKTPGKYFYILTVTYTNRLGITTNHTESGTIDVQENVTADMIYTKATDMLRQNVQRDQGLDLGNQFSVLFYSAEPN